MLNNCDPKSQQQQLISLIFGMQNTTTIHSEAFHRGLQVYQNNLLATAARALTITYPVVDKLLGEEAMKQLAKQLLKHTPPSSGDWADWGENLSEQLLTTPLTDDYPFLYDMTVMEWRLHQTARAQVKPFDVESLPLLGDSPLESLRIQLAPGIQLLESDFPVDVIWRAHQGNQDQFKLDTDALAKEINKHQGPCRLLIYQQHNLPHLQRITEAEYQWFQDIFAGHSLNELLDRHPKFEFSHWLSTALENHKIEKLFISDE
ncbi:DNA-binding domain-containing protein [Litoribacillus peritrichatus]|uniref:Putative DNA-binding domain-containing protein n=1 Tax=Litoribacillus peritrichatus TaxID=718191 RepID=A0ABP7MUP7_9GAMM